MKYIKRFFRLLPIIFVLLLIYVFLGLNNKSVTMADYETKEYVVQNEINKTDIRIEYPLLSSNKDDYSIINDYLYKSVVEERLDIFDSNQGLYYNGSYSIKLLNEKYISVLFETESYVEGAAYPIDNAFSLTFDINTNAVVDLYELINKSDLELTIEKESYNVIKAVNEFLTDPVFDSYTNIDNVNGYYITDEVVGLIFNLPHVAGDYAIVEIKMKVD